jgi:uncharacterized protein (DUF2164 family)
MGVEFVHKITELTAAIVELENENKRLKAQNEVLKNLLNQSMSGDDLYKQGVQDAIKVIEDHI